MNRRLAGDRPLRGLRVLVVEDHRVFRAALVLMLRALGIGEVYEARDGEEALEILEDQGRWLSVDVVLCDLDVPGMDYAAFLNEVAARRLARGVIISGRDAETLWAGEALVRTAGLSVVGRLRKPIGPEAIRAALERLPSNWQARA